MSEETKTVELCECLSCGYKGNKGLWVGSVIMENGDIHSFKRLVEAKEEDDGMFDLQPIVDFYKEEKRMDVKDVTGSSVCPKCHSDLFF